MRPLVDEIDARVLAGLLCWYRGETMKDKFGDGQDAPYIFDESGRGNHMSDAAGGSAPSMNANGCNGYATMLFTGDEELRGALVSGSIMRGGFAVVKKTAGGVWGLGGANEGTIGGLAAGDAGIYGLDEATTIGSQHTGTETYHVNGVATNDVTNTDAWNLLYYQSTSSDTMAGVIMGRYQGTDGYLTGEIAECGMFSSAQSDEARTLFFNALIAKYAITGDVGSPA